MMIEQIILEHLKDAGINALMEIPEGGGTPPFVVIEKTGGGEADQLRLATIAIQSYGSSLYNAAALNEQVISVMEQILELPEIASCDLNSDYNFTDTTKKMYRYQCVYDVVYYA